MIAVLVALQLASGDPRPAIVYEGIAPEVRRVELYEWSGDRPGRRVAVVPGSRSITLQARRRRSHVVLLVRADERYSIDGPFAWPEQDTRREPPSHWHRTTGGPMPPDTDASGRLELVRAGDGSSAWPLCFIADARKWACWGVADEFRGVLIVHNTGSIWWTPLASTQLVDFRATRWGRLIVLADPAPSLAPARITFAFPVAPPAGRMRAMRLDTARVSDTYAVTLSESLVWIAGNAIPPNAWLEIASDTTSPVYFPLEEVAGAPVSLPLHVTLVPRVVVQGRVVGAAGEVARGALVTVFRLIEPPAADRSRAPPRRVLATESVADDEGRFALAGLGEAQYEILAWHSQLGRASVSLRDSAELVIRLRSSGVVRGRVLADGRPVEGVGVISVPDPSAFNAAEDISEMKGGDARTTTDGRFSVMVSPSGGGELRIGGGMHPVKRIPLPRAPVPLFDAGDIELGRAIVLAIVIDGNEGCDLRATGPVGRTGLHMVSGSRTRAGAFEVALPEPGFWEFTLMCGQQSRPLSPSLVQVGASDSRREVRMIVR